jgi:hypothetical protein
MRVQRGRLTLARAFFTVGDNCRGVTVGPESRSRPGPLARAVLIAAASFGISVAAYGFISQLVLGVQPSIPLAELGILVVTILLAVAAALERGRLVAVGPTST